ncbi:MAG: hypothetical protein ACI8ZB_005082 [Desulforhopalus sp.]|jgi:hypothetical protein
MISYILALRQHHLIAVTNFRTTNTGKFCRTRQNLPVFVFVFIGVVVS